MRKSLVFGVLAMLASPAAAQAQDRDLNSGNFMLDNCSAGSSGVFEGVCWGRIEGFIAGNGFYRFDRKESLFCVPTEATNGQRMDVYLAYLRANPQRRHLPWSLLLAHALNEVWPCTGGPTMHWDPEYQTIVISPVPR